MFVPQLLGILLLTAVYVAGDRLAAALHLSIPGAAIGLVSCTAVMLALPDVRHHIRPGAVILLGLIPLFLVPVLARMAVRIDFTAPATWRAIAMLCIASLAGIVVTGLLTKLCLRKDPE